MALKPVMLIFRPAQGKTFNASPQDLTREKRYDVFPIKKSVPIPIPRLLVWWMLDIITMQMYKNMYEQCKLYHNNIYSWKRYVYYSDMVQKNVRICISCTCMIYKLTVYSISICFSHRNLIATSPRDRQSLASRGSATFACENRFWSRKRVDLAIQNEKDRYSGANPNGKIHMNQNENVSWSL